MKLSQNVPSCRPGWRSPGVILAICLLAVTGVMNLVWIGRDLIVRDGDEEGHVGAAELVMAEWSSGRPGEALLMSFQGDLGEYPPLVPGIVGGWWAAMGGGDPGRPAVRGVCLVGLLAASLGVACLARPMGGLALGVGVATLLFMPLPLGLSRHFMPEGFLVGAVTLAVCATERFRTRPSVLRALILGSTLGLAFLVKQTAVIYLLPVLAFRLPRRGTSALALGVGIALIAPWLIPHVAAQEGYARTSLAGPGDVSMLQHLLFYPWSLSWVGLGPLGMALLVLGLAAAVHREDADADRVRLALAWLLGSIAILFVLPRKDPRLLAPALPALALLASVAWSRARWRPLIGVLILGMAIMSWVGSFWGIPVPASAEILDPRCAQRWLRPPIDDDLGIGLVVEAARHAPPGAVRVLDPPPVPCLLRATFDWDYHLGPALRRGGVDRPVLRDDEPGSTTVLVSWRGPVAGWKGDFVVVPALGRSFWLAVR